MNELTFKSHTLTPIIVKNQPYLGYPQIADALQYRNARIVSDVYNRHADEFTPDMSFLTTVDTTGGKQQVRVFSLRGCHLLAMFSKTPVAKEFRKWVLDLIEQRRQEVDKPVIVSEHTRALPSCKKKIVLSAKAREEIREEIDHSVNNALERLFNPNPIENRNLFRFCSILQSVLSDSLDDILCTADKKDLENRRLKRALQKANGQLKQINASAQPIVIE